MVDKDQRQDKVMPEFEDKSLKKVEQGKLPLIAVKLHGEDFDDKSLPERIVEEEDSAQDDSCQILTHNSSNEVKIE